MQIESPRDYRVKLVGDKISHAPRAGMIVLRNKNNNIVVGEDDPMDIGILYEVIRMQNGGLKSSKL